MTSLQRGVFNGVSALVTRHTPLFFQEEDARTMQGRVKFFNFDRQFGFIEITDGPDVLAEWFVHGSHVIGDPVHKGDLVEFWLDDSTSAMDKDRGGWQCVDVQRIATAPRQSWSGGTGRRSEGSESDPIEAGSNETATAAYHQEAIRARERNTRPPRRHSRPVAWR